MQLCVYENAQLTMLKPILNQFLHLVIYRDSDKLLVKFRFCEYLSSQNL